MTILYSCLTGVRLEEVNQEPVSSSSHDLDNDIDDSVTDYKKDTKESYKVTEPASAKLVNGNVDTSTDHVPNEEAKESFGDQILQAEKADEKAGDKTDNLNQNDNMNTLKTESTNVKDSIKQEEAALEEKDADSSANEQLDTSEGSGPIDSGSDAKILMKNEPEVVQINMVKVVQDNVTGGRGDSFSEDTSVEREEGESHATEKGTPGEFQVGGDASDSTPVAEDSSVATEFKGEENHQANEDSSGEVKGEGNEVDVDTSVEMPPDDTVTENKSEAADGGTSPDEKKEQPKDVAREVPPESSSAGKDDESMKTSEPDTENVLKEIEEIEKKQKLEKEQQDILIMKANHHLKIDSLPTDKKPINDEINAFEKELKQNDGLEADLGPGDTNFDPSDDLTDFTNEKYDIMKENYDADKKLNGNPNALPVHDDDDSEFILPKHVLHEQAISHSVAGKDDFSIDDRSPDEGIVDSEEKRDPQGNKMDDSISKDDTEKENDLDVNSK